jgi:hypothetical protein
MLSFKIKQLKILAISYLALPILIFLLGWLKLPIAVISSAILVYCIYKYCIEKNITNSESISYVNILLIVGMIFLWLILSGTGGFGFQPTDYLKHNALFKDIKNQPWPISYMVDGKKMYLAHYLAYYLPTPTFFGSFSWKFLLFTNLIWTALGTCIAIILWLRFIGKYSYWLFIFFILVSGIQIVTLFYQHGLGTPHIVLDKIRNHGNMFWLNGLVKNGIQILLLTFPSNTDMMYWAPSHALPCWIGTGFLLNDIKDKTLKYSPLVISFLAFWSPLVMLGTAPILLFAILNDKKREWINMVNLVFAPIIFLIIASFLLSINAKELTHHLIFTDRSLIDGISFKRQLFAYFNFQFWEVLVWWLPSYWVFRKSENKLIRQLLWLSLILLSLIPLYHYGVWNDWCGRVAMPTIFIFHALIAMAFLNGNLKQKLVLLCIFMLASIGPLVAVLGSARMYRAGYQWNPPAYESINSLPEATKGWPIDQYVADENTFFFKYLAKKN